jgi:hypothetical protein
VRCLISGFLPRRCPSPDVTGAPRATLQPRLAGKSSWQWQRDVSSSMLDLASSCCCQSDTRG